MPMVKILLRSDQQDVHNGVPDLFDDNVYSPLAINDKGKGEQAPKKMACFKETAESGNELEICARSREKMFRSDLTNRSDVLPDKNPLRPDALDDKIEAKNYAHLRNNVFKDDPTVQDRSDGS